MVDRQNNTLATAASSPLAGATGIVFGASAGVGAALIAHLHDAGRVYAASRRGALPAGIAPAPHIMPCSCDVRDYAAVEHLIAGTPDDLDFIVSCVGVGFYAPYHADYSRYWKDIVETNLIGTVNILSNLHRLRPRCRQAIILGSMAAKRPSDTPGNGIYRASKVALETFLSDFRRDLRASGNRMKLCNLQPGFIQGTDFDRRFFESDPAAKKDLYASFESLKPADMAPVIRWILEQPALLDIGEVLVRPVGQPT